MSFVIRNVSVEKNMHFMRIGIRLIKLGRIGDFTPK